MPEEVGDNYFESNSGMFGQIPEAERDFQKDVKRLNLDQKLAVAETNLLTRLGDVAKDYVKPEGAEGLIVQKTMNEMRAKIADRLIVRSVKPKSASKFIPVSVQMKDRIAKWYEELQKKSENLKTYFSRIGEIRDREGNKKEEIEFEGMKDLINEIQNYINELLTKDPSEFVSRDDVERLTKRRKKDINMAYPTKKTVEARKKKIEDLIAAFYERARNYIVDFYGAGMAGLDTAGTETEKDHFVSDEVMPKIKWLDGRIDRLRAIEKELTKTQKEMTVLKAERDIGGTRWVDVPSFVTDRLWESLNSPDSKFKFKKYVDGTNEVITHIDRSMVHHNKNIDPSDYDAAGNFRFGPIFGSREIYDKYVYQIMRWYNAAKEKPAEEPHPKLWINGSLNQFVGWLVKNGITLSMETKLMTPEEASNVEKSVEDMIPDNIDVEEAPRYMSQEAFTEMIAYIRYNFNRVFEGDYHNLIGSVLFAETPTEASV